VVTGFLPSRRLEDDHYRADPLGVMLIGDASGRRIRLGDPIEVRVIRIEPLRGRVELEPADAAPRRPRRVGRAPVPRSRRGRAGARPR
jgi:ribonuclease R